jgi:hypothetical protein
MAMSPAETDVAMSPAETDVAMSQAEKTKYGRRVPGRQ